MLYYVYVIQGLGAGPFFMAPASESSLLRLLRTKSFYEMSVHISTYLCIYKPGVWSPEPTKKSMLRSPLKKARLRSPLKKKVSEK